jgi:lipoprotein-anchoring transpeptidase ErfK/SrfK
VLGERRRGRGEETQRPPKDGTQQQERSATPGQPEGPPPPETAAQTGPGGRASGRPSSAARAGLIAAVVVGVAVAAGVVGLAVLAVSGKGHGQGAAKPTGPPIRVVSVAPSAGTSRVNGDTSVQIAFSTLLAAKSAHPSISPAVAGQWQVSGSLLVFTPSTPLAPWTRYTLLIPAGRVGPRSVGGRLLTAPARVQFQTGGYSQLRLAELLGQLGYLPLSWQPDSTLTSSVGAAASGIAQQEQLAYTPPAGSFTWASGYPAILRSMWVPGQPNVVLRGAVMAFQAQHKLAVNGQITSKFWQALFTAAVSGDRNSVGYTYAIANKGSPETLTIWHDGHEVLRSLTNTGIPVDPTADGTFPVYLRYRFQIMSGTNPDGSSYADPVSFVSYFDGGEAVHYFPRGSYGYPQSLGCVELPYTDAERAWPYLTYGSLVSVTG